MGGLKDNEKWKQQSTMESGSTSSKRTETAESTYSTASDTLTLFDLNLIIDDLEVEQVQEAPRAAGIVTGKKKQTSEVGQMFTKVDDIQKTITKYHNEKLGHFQSFHEQAAKFRRHHFEND